ncbi:MAG: hypothetical protein GY953_33605, partial [bacterium]|nr:hypothetical protein [bacterium]
MIHQRVTIQFLPTGGSAADAIAAANQHVFIDLTAGTLSPARTNATGLLVTATAAGSAIPLDDSRQYLIVVLDGAPAAPPAANAAASVRVVGGRISVVPRIAIRIANSTGAPVARLACKLTVGASSSNVTTSAGGFIVSNNSAAGAVTVSSQSKALRSSTGAAPNATLSLAATPATRGATARIRAAAPAGAIDFHITEWRYTLSHNNPDGTAQTATVTRPANENATTFQQFWEGVLSASGSVSVRFVTGASVRATGAGA